MEKKTGRVNVALGERTSAKISDDADRIVPLAPGDNENQILWRANLVRSQELHKSPCV
jgi:hypothetical protein